MNHGPADTGVYESGEGEHEGQAGEEMGKGRNVWAWGAWGLN